ncbi:hypothetical protein D3C86_924030 [compost metagenome]
MATYAVYNGSYILQNMKTNQLLIFSDRAEASRALFEVLDDFPNAEVIPVYVEKLK